MAYVYKGINRSAPMARTAAFPLDEKSYFESLTEAQAAAASAKDAGDTTTVYYYGQIVTVVTAGVPVVYKIQKKKIEVEGQPTTYVGELVSLENAGEVGEQVLSQAKAYTDSEIQKLDVTDEAEAGKFVTAVSETDGKITVTRAALASTDLPEVPLEKLVNTGTVQTIPASFLPSYVDDVVEMKVTETAPSTAAVGDHYYNPTAKKLYVCKTENAWTEETPETGKIYVNPETNVTYRWGGSDMVKIGSDLALGETSSTAFRGDYGKTAYDHATETKSGAVNSGLYKITVTAQGHIGETAAVEASDIPSDAFQFADGTNKFTVTKPDGTTQDVNVTPSIADATTTASGLMSKDDKSKLDGLAEGATKVEASTTNGNIKINGTETTVYTHPSYTAVDAAAKKVGLDTTGHVVLGEALTKNDVGLGNVNNTSITVSATDGVTDNTNGVTYKYNHPTATETTAAAVKVGMDGYGHVVLGGALTASDVGLGNVKNQAITVTTTSVSDGTNTFDKYVHPAGAQAATDAAAVKVGVDANGHAVIGAALTAEDVGLGNVKNQAITVTDSSVSDGTNTFEKFVHPTTTATTAAAVKVGNDTNGHVVIGDALTGADVGVSATTHSVTVDGTTFEHEYQETSVTAAAVKVGKDAKNHVVLGDALTAADVGVSATETSVTVGSTTFNKYVHPTTTAADAAAVKVGKDASGHVVLGDALTTSDLTDFSTEMAKKQDSLSFDGTYNKDSNKVATVSTVTTAVSNLGKVLNFKGVLAAKPATTEGYKCGDVIIVGNKEYVVADTSTDPEVTTLAWVELGDEGSYALKTQKIAGIELQGDISAADLRTALGVVDGATKVEASTTNGNIKINGTETTVYDDTQVKSDIAANTAAAVSLSSTKANKVTVNTSSTTATFVKVDVNSEGVVAGTTAVTKSDISGLVGEASATQSGLMTSTSYNKLDGIAEGAQVNVVEGAVDHNNEAFTITDKKIVLDNLILDGGSATSTIA